jgi:hypothetical protein
MTSSGLPAVGRSAAAAVFAPIKACAPASIPVGAAVPRPQACRSLGGSSLGSARGRGAGRGGQRGRHDAAQRGRRRSPKVPSACHAHGRHSLPAL